MRYMRHHSAELHFAEIRRREARILVVRVTGLLTQQSFDYFVPHMAEMAHGAESVITRLDTAVNIEVRPPPIEAQLHQGMIPPPKAVVCPAELVDLWERHAYEMAQFGIRRAIFSPEQALWAESWAFLEAKNRQRHHLSGPSTAPAPLES